MGGKALNTGQQLLEHGQDGMSVLADIADV